MRTALAALALCAACTPRALSVPEEGVDLAVVRDASLAPLDASSCGNQHTRTPVAILQIVPIDGQPRYTYGASARVLVSFPYRERCDQPGDVEVTIMPGGATTFVELKAHDWLGTTGCDATKIETREVTLSSAQLGGNPRVVIRDAVGMNGASLELMADIGAPPACVRRFVGDPCQADCECGDGFPRSLLCLVGTDGFSRCGEPCHSDTQCQSDGGTVHCIGEPMHACGWSNRCRIAEECRFGERLEQCVCTRPAPQGGRLCGCDADCPAEELCTSDGFCARICTGDRTCSSASCSGEGCEFCTAGLCVSTVD